MTVDNGGPEAAPADVDLNRVWTGIAAHVWGRRPGRLEALGGRLLRSPGLARAVAATPSLLWPWLTASTVMLLVAAVITPGTGTPQVPLVPLLVPAVAAAGAAYAYGPGVDPAFELSRSMAVSDRRVLLARAVAIFVLNTVLGLIASVIAWLVSLAASAVRTGVTVEWLAPMVAVSAAALAAATVARSANVGVATGVGAWCITLLGGVAAGGQPGTAVADRSLVMPYLLAGAVCAAVVVGKTRTLKGSAS